MYKANKNILLASNEIFFLSTKLLCFLIFITPPIILLIKINLSTTINQESWIFLRINNSNVEAPVSGSMILAGILLKLGLLWVYTLLLKVGVKINYIWVSIRLVGGTLVSLISIP